MQLSTLSVKLRCGLLITASLAFLLARVAIRAQGVFVNAQVPWHPVMLDAQGKPRDELFRVDGLHMNAQGYALWTSIIKPILLNRFGPPSS